MADNKALRALPWFIGGVAIGAAVGLLYAPKAGKETREDVAEWLKQKREKTRELAAKLRDRIPQKKDQVLQAFRAGKEALQNHKEQRETVGV